ncbi:helix-turn-helix transcriptional regulator [Streptomyces sp. Li-HN-5-11]|uniref:ArsR/SmtB family transcription factor n=1 Tax=Streptomyces sp. Li-HN-5-11 TaxID=3075432 RepID=UPI0028B1DF2A|nr:helix-turn-helix transcriptional regulator [Streptomyces sp. Li-HN-5-11]WNM29443.1 helix-turn-helix transcriptional regulator [Streptomyces sp. Li-HN-5-11]
MARQVAGSSTSHRGTPEHTHPDDVPVQTALAALADPVRLSLVRELAGSAEWSRSCGSFDVPVGKAALSHHFAVLRAAGLVEQRDEGPRRVNRLRRAEFDARFPGLLDLVLREVSHNSRR